MQNEGKMECKCLVPILKIGLECFNREVRFAIITNDGLLTVKVEGLKLFSLLFHSLPNSLFTFLLIHNNIPLTPKIQDSQNIKFHL